MRKSYYLLLGLLFCMSAHAYDFESGGIYYNIISPTTVCVTHNGSIGKTYSGDVVIPETVNHGDIDYVVSSIGEGAFYRSWQLISVTLPGSITSIGDYAFGNSGLSSISIPANVTSIGERAFNDCYIRSIVIPDNVESIGKSAFEYCRNLSSITFGNGITYIGKSVFYGCSGLTSVVIPENVVLIEEYAFIICSNLVSVTIPNSVTNIRERAFNDCALESVFIPESVIDMSLEAFDCSLTVSDKNPRYAASEGVLFNKDFSELIRYPEKKTAPDYTIPNSVVTIKPRAFMYCKNLKSVTIPDCVTSIEEEAFYDSGLTSIVVPESITELKYAVFGECYRLQSVTISNGVTSIGEGTFAMCSNLQSVTIPASVASIAGDAFYKCSSLTDIYMLNTVPVSILDDTFTADNYNNARLHVPQGKAADYRNAEGWKNFVDIVDDAVSGIGSSYLVADAGIFASGNNVIIENARLGEPVFVYDASGRLLKTVRVTGERSEIRLPMNRIYVIKCANKAVKIKL